MSETYWAIRRREIANKKGEAVVPKKAKKATKAKKAEPAPAVLTEADAEADLRGYPRPDNPSYEQDA
jgi:hypothetical protein